MVGGGADKSRQTGSVRDLMGKLQKLNKAAKGQNQKAVRHTQTSKTRSRQESKVRQKVKHEESLRQKQVPHSSLKVAEKQTVRAGLKSRVESSTEQPGKTQAWLQRSNTN